MNILVLSHLTSNVASGPNWSVPASVKSLSEFDNVLWVNMTDVVMSHWKEVASYHNIAEYGSLKELPSPFDNPDVVIFEGFYFIDDVNFSLKLKRKGIPYIIVPRGSLTWQALHNKARLKKTIAHFFFFDRFVKNARAIQYLTEREREDSLRRFKTYSFVIPNGFNEPARKKDSFSNVGIKSVFIGRLSIYHKGIDNLLNAIAQIREQLRSSSFSLNMYGPCHKYDYDAVKKMVNDLNISDIVVINNAISGIDKEEVLLDSDLFILTSRLEGHPMGLIEALAYGLPCFVSKGSNMKEEIENYNAGWTCEGNMLDIKEALLKIIEERVQLNVKSEGAKKLALLYDWNNIAETFHNKVEKIIKT